MGLICNYGTYNCGKSSDIIKIYHNYIKKSMNALCYVMTNSKIRSISNNLGIRCPATPVPIGSDFNFVQYIQVQHFMKKVDIVLVDDAHLLTETEVLGLRHVADKGIPVVVFGLRSDYKGKIYNGFANLAAYSDRIEEIKGMCWCNKRATMNACVDIATKVKLLDNSKMDRGEYRFEGVCSKHWKEGKIEKGVLGENVYSLESLTDFFKNLMDIAPDGINPNILKAELGIHRYEQYNNSGCLVELLGHKVKVDFDKLMDTLIDDESLPAHLPVKQSIQQSILTVYSHSLM